MSRVISFRDLKIVPSLSQYTEVELLSTNLDDKVNNVLGQLGFNLKAPILYVPTKHRDMQGGVGVGFRAVGHINNDHAYLSSNICPMIERLIWASLKDPSLARELAKMMGHTVNLDDTALEIDDPMYEEEIEDDYEMTSAQIVALTTIRDVVRGSPYNEQGILKTPKEYKSQ